MWDRNPVRVALVHMLPAVADQCGLALTPLLTRAGLSADETLSGDGAIARGQACALLLHLARSAAEPTIGLDLGAAADPVRLGLTGQALFAGRTLRECLGALARQMPALQAGVMFRLDERDGVAHWSHRLADSDPEHARVLNEGIAAFMTSALKAITGMDPAQLSLGLPHRAQAPLRIYEDKLGARIAFGAGGGISFKFDARWLDHPNRLFCDAPAAVGASLPDDIQRLPPEAAWLDDEALVGVVSRLIESSALSGSLCLADTARSMGFSPRSLQRRLASLGTSFEAHVDAWRHRQARLYLADAGMPIGSVARALGYGHPAHFVRAFRRWEGRTPLAFRRAVGVEASAAAG
ncbi:AraC family transcriptional regulator ligand-binding domain-containing protein [Labrys okinawensis]|uniref:helix-turn-helix transcriptional regulator n=1 Tax=Labrys okinawensis TaxID=346911 RepID=UPI0039BCA398